jgi:hypothetical protein
MEPLVSKRNVCYHAFGREPVFSKALIDLSAWFFHRPSFVAEGFIRLVEDDSMNGQAMYFDAANQTSGLHQFSDSNIS